MPIFHNTDSFKTDSYVLHINFLNNFECIITFFASVPFKIAQLVNLPTTESPMATLLTPDPVCVTIPATSYPTMYLLRGHFLYTSERTWFNDKSIIEPF